VKFVEVTVVETCTYKFRVEVPDDFPDTGDADDEGTAAEDLEWLEGEWLENGSSDSDLFSVDERDVTGWRAVTFDVGRLVFRQVRTTKPKECYL
jgi:hypothetical protein